MSKRYITLCITVAIVAGATGWLLHSTPTPRPISQTIEIRDNSKQFKYITPLLLVDTTIKSKTYNPLQTILQEYTDNILKNNSGSALSIYFRDLNTGRWTGVNEDQLYNPSSMLKVAVMMTYLKQSVSNPDVLTTLLTYEVHKDPGQNYPPSQTLSSGQQPVKSLINSMIIYSDNDALASLLGDQRQNLIDLLKTLDIPPPNKTTLLDFMSPKMYARFFRTLFSSTYLPEALSNQTLELLTRTTFTKGIAAGLPPEIPVAHKFGENSGSTKDGQILYRELHDCGIVYYPDHPYFLCVMTKGQDFPSLEHTISDISNLVYKNIEQMY